MNNIQEKFNNIALDKKKWGTIFSISNKDRGIGKSYNLQKVADYYGFTVICKYPTYPTRDNLQFICNPSIDKIRGSSPNIKYVIDEGFTLDEIREFKKFGNVVFAVHNLSIEKDIVELVNTPNPDMEVIIPHDGHFFMNYSNIEKPVKVGVSVKDYNKYW